MCSNFKTKATSCAQLCRRLIHPYFSNGWHIAKWVNNNNKKRSIDFLSLSYFVFCCFLKFARGKHNSYSGKEAMNVRTHTHWWAFIEIMGRRERQRSAKAVLYYIGQSNFFPLFLDFKRKNFLPFNASHEPFRKPSKTIHFFIRVYTIWNCITEKKIILSLRVKVKGMRYLLTATVSGQWNKKSL